MKSSDAEYYAEPPSHEEDEAEAQRIIEDYLRQVAARLPPRLAGEVIPELRSHLLEQASQPKGRLTPAAAWEAVVAMGSPDMVAREFRRDSMVSDEQRLAAGFLDALQPQYQAWFWRAVVVLVVVDLLYVAFLATFAVASPHPVIELILAGVVAQIWVATGIGVTYLVLLLLSYPQGPPLADLLRRLFEQPEQKDKLVRRTQRRVHSRVRKLEHMVSRRHLLGEMAGSIVGGLLAMAAAAGLSILLPYYPAFDIQFLVFIGVVAFAQAALTGIRAIVDAHYLPLARLLATLNVLFSLVTIYVLALFFFGPLEMPLPLWANGSFTLLYWKQYLAPHTWIFPLVTALVIISMIVRIYEIHTELQPPLPPQLAPPQE